MPHDNQELSPVLATWAEIGQSRCAKQGAIGAMAKLAEMRDLGVYGRDGLVLSATATG
jgi:hypothetical protein